MREAPVAIAVVITVIIVLAMNLVRSLLISARIIFPALSAMLVFKSARNATVCSAVLSVVCVLTCMLSSIVGGTVVCSPVYNMSKNDPSAAQEGCAGDYYISRRAASVTWETRTAVVTAPTPPGTGVIAPATGSASPNRTSPHSFPVSSL